MRVLVACDSLAGLPALEASEVVARAFAEQGAQVAVVPLAVEGEALHESLRSADADAKIVAPPDLEALAEALFSDSESLILDLTGIEVPDFGRQLLGPDPLAGLDRLRAALRTRDVVALVAPGDGQLKLTGLDGLAATRGRAAGLDLAAVLKADGEAERWADELGLTPGPGSGAAGGLGLALGAAGVRISEPLAELTLRFGLGRTAANSELVVTGAEDLDFHRVGGPIVKHMIDLAVSNLSPVIAVAGRNYVSARELRQLGIENADPVLETAGTEPASVAGLERIASQIATTWRW